MLARSTKLHHPLGVDLVTPLLVPSFSSKGFGVDKEGKSEIKVIFGAAAEYLTDIMLVSAYDLAYQNLEPIESAITQAIIVDSGGYEVSDIYDLSSVYQYPVSPREWTEEKLREVYDSWPQHLPAIFVSFDRPDLRQPLVKQIEVARQLMSKYRHQMHTLLIKPESAGQRYVQVNNVVAWAGELKGFSAVGFTEKELGNSILSRMENIAKIRFAMDDAGVSAPIHVYGSLDPITSVLYFLSGAEIFDGSTWLRYGYADGLACYYHNYGVRRVGIDRIDGFIKLKMMVDNLGHLVELKRQMHKFLLDGDFKKFVDNEKIFRESYDLLRTQNGRIQQ